MGDGKLTVGTSASSAVLSGLSTVAAIGDRALADSAWLKANQPSACYKAAHQSATEAYGEIKLAADSIVAASKTADVPTIDAQLVMIRDEIAALESSAAAAGNC
jgi:hypothetical protein